jgi:hypothetical protein
MIVSRMPVPVLPATHGTVVSAEWNDPLALHMQEMQHRAAWAKMTQQTYGKNPFD